MQEIRREDVLKLKRIFESSRRAVFFGGAGVSTESGIPDFRSEDGLYKQKYTYPPEAILSHTFFLRHPEEFFDFYREKMLFLDALPNAAHYKIAALEREGKLAGVITQNIDGLHQKAGSKTVLELHGSVHRNHCEACGMGYPVQKIVKSKGVPRCACGGVIKPDVVLYEEPLDPRTTERAVELIRAADNLIIGGTSLNVYPAAGLVQYFRGENIVVVNRGEIPVRGAVFIDAPIAKLFSMC